MVLQEQGLNTDLLNLIKIKLYQKDADAIGLGENRQFDSKGNVIRDHKKELELYSKDEEDRLLSTLSTRHFDSFRQYHSLRKEQEEKGFEPIVKVIALKKPEYIHKESWLDKFIHLFAENGDIEIPTETPFTNFYYFY